MDVASSAVKEISQEEGNYSLIPSSIRVVVVCVMKLSCAVVFIIITYAVWLKLCGCRRQSVPGDINEQYGCEGRLEQLNVNMQAQSVRLRGC